MNSEKKRRWWEKIKNIFPFAFWRHLYTFVRITDSRNLTVSERHIGVIGLRNRFCTKREGKFLSRNMIKSCDNRWIFTELFLLNYNNRCIADGFACDLYLGCPLHVPRSRFSMSLLLRNSQSRKAKYMCTVDLISRLGENIIRYNW